MQNQNKKQNKKKESEQLLFPSEKIGVEEEFLPGKGTYLENHEIRSAVFGEKYIDKRSYRSKVYSLPKGTILPRRNQMVVGEIIRVSNSVARINITHLGNQEVVPYFSAILHVSDASRDYVRNLDNLYRRGDIIRATIIDAKSIPIQLESKKSDNGVIYTTCEKCGEEVDKIKKNTLRCRECGWKQTRGTAINFGKYKY